jgi:hypothetical protein
MSQTVAGLQVPTAIGRIDGHTNYASQAFVVASGVTVTNGDFVYFSSGAITSAAAYQARLIGMAEGTGTGTATGTVTVSVCVDRNMRYLLKSVTSLTISNGTNSYIGQYFDITNGTGTGVQTVTAVGTTVGQFVLIGIPGMTGFPSSGLTGLPTGNYGVFVLANSFLNPYVAG